MAGILSQGDPNSNFDMLNSLKGVFGGGSKGSSSTVYPWINVLADQRTESKAYSAKEKALSQAQYRKQKKEINVAYDKEQAEAEQDMLESGQYNTSTKSALDTSIARNRQEQLREAKYDQQSIANSIDSTVYRALYESYGAQAKLMADYQMWQQQNKYKEQASMFQGIGRLIGQQEPQEGRSTSSSPKQASNSWYQDSGFGKDQSSGMTQEQELEANKQSFGKKAGSTAGSAIGSAYGGPIGGQVGGALGSEGATVMLE